MGGHGDAPFPPADSDRRRAGHNLRRRYHAMVEGREREGTREYRLKSLGYYTGTARFGPKRCPVALVDANANGLYGDPFRSFSPDGEKMGDMLLVDANKDGRFEPGG